MAKYVRIPQTARSSNGTMFVLHPKSKMKATLVSQDAKQEGVYPIQEDQKKITLDENVFALSQEEDNDTLQSPQKRNDTIRKEKIDLKSERNDVTVLFYDPEDLPETTQSTIPIPSKVFDKHGNDVDLSGKQVLLLPPDLPKVENTKSRDPQTLPKNDTSTDDSNNVDRSTKSKIKDNKMQFSTKRSKPTDGLIVIGTVLTMAMAVGAVSARRLRSCNSLNCCIENEPLEEDMGYDDDSTRGLFGKKGGYNEGYDTFSNPINHSHYGGDMRWRGDLEKFDV